MSRIIGYYQTFGPLSADTSRYTHLHLASIHFGTESAGQPYIHLNDLDPTDPAFDRVWSDLGAYKSTGGIVVLMIGGAGGGYQALFDNYATCYPLLRNLVQCKSTIIDGIDFDVEEYIKLDDLVRLTADLARDFPALFFTAAPLAGDLATDSPGMGGFCYKDLESRLADIGLKLEYYNGQFYTDYTAEAYASVVQNGYDPARVVMGQLAPQDLARIVPVVTQLVSAYGPSFGGVYTWEYATTAPTPTDWATAMRHIMPVNF